MDITIKINTDNDALNHECKLDFECGILYDFTNTSKILHLLAEQMKSGGFQELQTWNLYDINGNVCGSIEVSK